MHALSAGSDTTRISTHSLRKTFVGRMHQASGHDLIKTQRAVGHSLPITTARYLKTDTADLDRSSSPLLA
jgi:integrase